jgi:predicted AAA+ superfamily ATPase
MYLPRQAEKRLFKISKSYPVVMVCGPRQVGKLTLVQSNRKMVSLANPNEKNWQ